MNFRPANFLILCIAILAAAGDLSAQVQDNEAGKKAGKEAGKAKVVQVQDDKKTAKKAANKAVTGEPKAASKAAAKEELNTCVLADLEMADIYGNKVALKKYQGKVVLVVNVASHCGFTGQYRPLQALHKQYGQHGFAVIAFPCNQFGKQEPADEPAIDAFCKKKFGIEFELFAKVDVKGKKQAELFKRLTKQHLAPAGKGAIYWNFEKFLIGKDGKAVARFRSNVSPDDEKIVSKIKDALGIVEDKSVKSDSTDTKETGVAKPQAENEPQANKADKKLAPKDKHDKKS